MKQSRIITGLMLSTTVLTLASPVPVAAATNTPANNSEAVSTKQVDKSAATLTTADETGATSSTTNDKIQTLTEQTMILHKIIAKDGTVKAIVKNASSAESSSGKTLGLTQDKFQGVNGAKFVVYDITDLMNEVIKEKLQVANKDISSNQVDEAVEAQTATNLNEDSSQTEVTKAIPTVKPYVKVTNPTEKSSSSAATSDSTTSSKVDAEKRTESSSSVVSVDTSSKTSSETNNSSTDKIDPTLLSQIEALRKDDSLRKELAERAGKLDNKQLKEFATVTTEHNKELNEDGVATVKIPLDGKYHAYYVVNSETPKEAHATNAKPIVVLTPVTDEQGLYAESFTVFPKSDAVPEEKQPQEVVTSEKMYQTGKEHQGLLKQLVQFSKQLFKLFQ